MMMPPALWTHLPRESPRMETATRLIVKMQLTIDTIHLLSCIQAAWAPSA